MPDRSRPVAIIPTLAALLMAEVCWLSAEDSKTLKSGRPKTAATDPSGIVDVVSLNESELDESSGLAASRRCENHFWTHNDSGGKPRLYAFDTAGRKTGQLSLNLAESVDWEDMATFTQDDVARLLVADCGDNQNRRPAITLYLLDEPDPRQSTFCRADQTISLKFPDGPRNCEAIAVDQQRNQIVLVTKSPLPSAGVYVLPLPERDAAEAETSVTARRVCSIPVPMVTAMDIDQISGDVWVTSYFQVFHFRCSDREQSIRTQLSVLPAARELPRWKQIEAVAVDAATEIWVTSEGSPAPLGRLPRRPAGGLSPQTSDPQP